MSKKEHKVTWRKNYGDDMDTDDTVMWIDGEPRPEVGLVSPMSSQCFVAYVYDKERGYFDTRREAKEFIEEVVGIY